MLWHVERIGSELLWFVRIVMKKAKFEMYEGFRLGPRYEWG